MIISTTFGNRNLRLQVVKWIVGAGLVLLFAGLWRVQVLHRDQYGGKEQKQSLRRIRIPAVRGDVKDRHGEVLAYNRPSYDVVFYLDQLGRVSKKQDIVELASRKLAQLGAALGAPVTLSDEDVRIHYSRRRPLPMTICNDLPAKQVATFVERVTNFPGADLAVTPLRVYPLGNIGAHVLGYVGKPHQNPEEEISQFYYYQPDTIGKQGIERACNQWLRGSPGGRTIRVDPRGADVGEVGNRDGERGANVELTLDAHIQRITEQALAEVHLKEGKQIRGAAVVLDPRSGEVLAMASHPTFDPNLFNPGVKRDLVNAVLQDQSGPMLNRAIGARYAPGSTFKPITLLAGLESGTIQPSDTAVCKGSYQIGNWRRPFRCWASHGHGKVDASAAMKQSCDVWFYKEGIQVGPQAIADMARQFGLGMGTQIDLGGDYKGLVPTPAWKKKHIGESWYDGDTAQYAIGQSYLLTTPLQMANVAATFANGGTRWKPHLIRRVIRLDGQVLSEIQPEVLGRVTASRHNIEIVRKTMLDVVEAADGTGKSARVPGFKIAGKTGTAEFDSAQGRIKRTWFIGFAPYENPQVAIALVIEDGDSGGHTAAPAAGKIFAGALHRSADVLLASNGQYHER